MIEAALVQSMLFVIPIFGIIVLYLFIDLALDIVNDLKQKDVKKENGKEEPVVDKTKEYFNI